ncbi:MAG: hypothetical protein AAGE13_14080 [Pseudomonadota bacterium]
MTFPFRLILGAYGLAALAALGASAVGTAPLWSLLIFWLGGSALVFVLPAIGMALTGAASAEAEPWRRDLLAERAATRTEAGLAAWEADLAVDQMRSRKAADLAAWQEDAEAEFSDAADAAPGAETGEEKIRPLRSGTERRGTGNRRQGTRRGG